MLGGGTRFGLILCGLVVIMAIVGRWLPVTERVGALVQPVRDLGTLGMFAFVGLYVVGVVVMLPGLPMTLAGGLLYGPYVGTALVSIASTTGASLAFLVSRTVARTRVKSWVESSPRLRSIDMALSRRGAWVVLLLRLTPLVPFNLLNYALGVCGVRLLPYILASLIGMLPATVAYVTIGASFGLSTPGSVGWGSRTLVVTTTLAASLGLSVFARAALQNIEGQPS